MKPYTVHYVVTTEDCLAIGGHFYSSHMYTWMLSAMVVEHYIGNLVTNTSHLHMPIILYQHFAEVYERAYGEVDADTVHTRFEDILICGEILLYNVRTCTNNTPQIVLQIRTSPLSSSSSYILLISSQRRISTIPWPNLFGSRARSTTWITRS